MPDEQAITVPKISLDRIPQRSVDLAPQMVEQLVEVPTVLTLSSLQQTAEQIVDIPVPRGRDRRLLQGSLPRQSSTAAGVVQSVDIPVRGGLRGFLPGQSSAQRTVEQLFDSSSGGLQDFHLGQGSAASSSGREDEAFSGFFALFPELKKKVRRPQPARVRSCPPVSAHGRGRLMRTWTLRTSRQLSWWRTRSSCLRRRRTRAAGSSRRAPRVVPSTGIGARAGPCGASLLGPPRGGGRGGGRGRRGARGSSRSPLHASLAVCGYGAVGKGSALALRCLVLVCVHCRPRR